MKATVTRANVMGLQVWFGRTSRMARAHTHHDLEFNYVLEGSMTYLMGGSLVTIPPGRLAAIWGAMPHQSLQGAEQQETRMAWVTAPLTSALLCSLPEGFTRALLERGIVLDTASRPADLPLLEQWREDLAGGAAGRRQLVLREIEARLQRLAVDFAEEAACQLPIANCQLAEGAGEGASGLPSPSPARESIGNPSDSFAAVQRMAAYLTGHFRDPVSVTEVAGAANLHPNYAMTLFRRHTGMTINTYLTRQRVAHAQRLLATTPQPILEICYASGFGSPSRFFEAFQQHAGCSPRQFRRRLGPTAATSPDTAARDDASVAGRSVPDRGRGSVRRRVR